MSRQSILDNIKSNQPPLIKLADMPIFNPSFDDAVKQFIEVARTIGCEVYLVENYEQIISIIKGNYLKDANRIITAIEPLHSIADNTINTTPHDYENADLYIVRTKLAIAENGAVWITENDVQERVLPFIAQHLAVVIHKEDIVSTMHDAYKNIDTAEYGFATFIAGPSKTADIEQSLVVGAHGPRSMIVFVL